MIEITTKAMINASSSDVWKVVSEINYDSGLWKELMRTRKTSSGIKKHNQFRKSVNKCFDEVFYFPMEGIKIKWKRSGISVITDVVIIPMGSQTLLQIETNYKIENNAYLSPGDMTEDLKKEGELIMRTIMKRMEKRIPAGTVNLHYM